MCRLCNGRELARKAFFHRLHQVVAAAESEYSFYPTQGMGTAAVTLPNAVLLVHGGIGGEFSVFSFQFSLGGRWKRTASQREMQSRANRDCCRSERPVGG